LNPCDCSSNFISSGHIPDEVQEKTVHFQYPELKFCNTVLPLQLYRSQGHLLNAPLPLLEHQHQGDVLNALLPLQPHHCQCHNFQRQCCHKHATLLAYR
jgi:hypothetical protein